MPQRVSKNNPMRARDKNVLSQLRLATRQNQDEFAENAGISPSTLKRAEQGKEVAADSALIIAKAHNKQVEELFFSERSRSALVPRSDADVANTGSKPLKRYTWGEVEASTSKVHKKVFDEFHPDALLTFPGPSLTFTGLVLAALPPEVAIRVPVYTCIFVDEKAPEPGGLHPVLTEPDDAETAFKILVPAALTDGDPEHQRRIVAIDDTIISGVTMRALRKYFRGRGYADRVPFACCVCYEARTVRGERPPEAIGMVSSSPKFYLPWGDGFCFEERMRLHRDTSHPHPPDRPAV